MKYVMSVSQDDAELTRDLWIEEGRVRYSDLPQERSGIIQLSTKNFKVVPGKVTIEENVGEVFRKDAGSSYVKRLLLYGFTAFVHLIDIKYESECMDRLKLERDSLKDCPLDYVHAVRVPLSRLSESWIRRLKQQSISILFISTDSVHMLKATPWQRLFEAMFPKRMLLICVPSSKVTSNKKKRQIEDTWAKIIQTFRINSYIGFPKLGEPISVFLTKRIGLFPKKGSLVMGSDADYLMYGTFHVGERPMEVPDIVVLKGRVVKVGKQWSIEGVKGEELTSLVPEKFLPIQDIHRYSDNDST
ncbi:hypothetical protein [Evansella tamaricis]|uniref:Uncharacterized protein n=1 Tax=Evansella tamaricis TaxID=2069301 RepID=A0ABS6JDQ0_9BACI|nr:hypothetical protein [Evansella tamaricis]MBU9711812.1 hypothetical protein [Evansella tamaricis]